MDENVRAEAIKPAIEFVGILQESAQDTLKKCLEKLGAPEEVITLAGHVTDLGYYLEKFNDPRVKFGPEGFDIQEVIIETVNNIAALGGTFDGPVGETRSRKGTMLDGFDEAKYLEEQEAQPA